MLSVKHTGVPVPQLVYGSVLQKVTEREEELANDPRELEVRAIFKQRADAAEAKLSGLPSTYAAEKGALLQQLDDLKASNAELKATIAGEKTVAEFPASEAAARVKWTADKGAAIAKSAAASSRHAIPRGDGRSPK